MRSRDTIGATLLYICAAGALLSAVAATADVTDADPAAQGVEVWRLVGCVFFAVVFVLLARAPRQLRGLWEVTIAAKAALPVAALTIASDADEATTLLVFDGALVVVLAVAYVVMSGWTADRPNRSTAAGPG